MKEYKFYGWEHADVPAAAKEYEQIKNPRHLYELLSEIWCADTCAPRMRDEWTKENMTLGQCSITAFLAQDIFGGDVYGILRPGGNYHCYNVAGGCTFDLTSEQFGDEALSYENNPIQLREVHFEKEEKRLRYEYLKEELKKIIGECIHTVEEAVSYINKVGFLPLFKNDIPGFSLEERTASEYWWSGDIKRDPWEWREIIARSGQVAYGKFFDKKAGFISKEWFPCFANYRREGYDFDALWDDEKASIRQKKIMDLFAEENADAELYSFEVKQKAGFGKGGEKNFEGTVTELEMKMYLCMRDFRQRKNKKGESYGWHVSVYSTPEHLWGYDYVTSAYREDAEESWKRIVKHMNEIYPIAAEAQIGRVLGISQGGVLQRRKSNRAEAKD